MDRSFTTPLSHRALIDRIGGPAALGRLIGVEANTTKAWKRLDSIPAGHWQAIAEAGAATLPELAGAAACRSHSTPIERAAA